MAETQSQSHHALTVILRNSCFSPHTVAYRRRRTLQLQHPDRLLTKGDRQHAPPPAQTVVDEISPSLTSDETSPPRSLGHKPAASGSSKLRRSRTRHHFSGTHNLSVVARTPQHLVYYSYFVTVPCSICKLLLMRLQQGRAEYYVDSCAATRMSLPRPSPGFCYICIFSSS